MAYVKKCPKCGSPMVEYSNRKHYSLDIRDGEIVGVEMLTIELARCEKCGYSEVEENRRYKKLPVKLPVELIYAIVRDIANYVYHNLP